MTIKLTAAAIEEIRAILSSPALKPYMTRLEAEERQIKARNLRDEVNSDWLMDALTRISGVSSVDAIEPKQSALINEATGKPHTVESMVAFYRDKVGLDAIHKSSEFEKSEMDKSASDAPLSTVPADQKTDPKKKDSDIKLNEMIAYIDGHISSHRGYVEAPAIIYDLREVFGSDLVQLHLKNLKDIIESKIKAFEKNKPQDRPRVELYSRPQKVNEGIPENTNIFENIKDR